MGYPTGVFAPATRSNGQTIDAGHVNDVQAELTAIENALLGTITHSLNVSGNSTLAAAQIANSTLVNAQIANSTFSVRPTMPPPHAVKVVRASSVTLGSSAASTVVWDTQEFITNSSMHSLASDQERLIPQSTGLYECIAQLNYSFNSTGYRGLSIRDSSNGVVGSVRVHASTSEEMFVQAAGVKRFDVLGGYLVVTTLSSGASTLSLTNAAGGNWAVLRKL